MLRCGPLNPFGGDLSLLFLGELSASVFVTGSHVDVVLWRSVVGEGAVVGMTYASQFRTFPELGGSLNQVSIGTLFEEEVFE